MSLSIERLTAALADRYRIERELGQGGMATVYLAEDLKHERKVAIKVLRPELAAVIGAERFLKEVKTTANLQHPHILGLIDSGESDAFLWYAMPYVDGESLRDRLDREKQLPVGDAVRLATEVAAALDYAHRHGVIHRDIKPENILLHDGSALVADFGIALAASSAGTRMTETGMSLGTPHYMSPEQAMGERDLDARSDVYALGCVLYEMLAGEPPFTGPTAQAIVAKVMTATPEPITTYRKTVPRPVVHAVHVAIQKLPADRFATAADFATALAAESVALRDAIAEGRLTTSHWLRDWRSVAAMVGVAALGLFSLVPRDRPDETGATSRQDYVTLSDSMPPSGGVGRTFAYSPSGNELVYVTASGGTSLLARKRSNQLKPTMIPGTSEAKWPNFAPDGVRLVFVRTPFQMGSLETIALGGGAARVLVADSVQFGATWGDDGYIYYARAGFLYRIPEGGGTPDTLTHRSDGEREWDSYPVPLPGGRAVLFSRQEGAAQREVMVYDLQARQERRLVEGLPLAVLSSGVLLYTPAGTSVLAQRFDLTRLELMGEVETIATGLRINGFAVADAAFSDNGAVLYWADAGSARTVVRVDRVGRAQVVDAEWPTPQADTPKLSPDGRRLALSVGTGLVVKQLDTGPATQIVRPVSGRNFLRPNWHPDGRSLLFYTSGVKDSVLSMRDDGVGGATSVVDEPRGVADAIWSPDGQWIVYRTSVEGANGSDIFAQRVEGGTPLQLLTSTANEVTPVLSPDGKWLAYASDESGIFEIYLCPFPNVGDRRVQVSNRGGVLPRWSAGSGELFFVAGDNQMTAVRVKTSPTLELGPLVSLFSMGSYLSVTSFHQNYDVTADGKQFYTIASGGTQQLVRVDNWLADFPKLRSR